MIKIILAAATISLATPCFADTVGNARRVLEMWDPLEVTFSGGTLTAVLPQRRITPQMYPFIIQAGICLAPLRGIDLREVKQIEILNEFSAQGYVYEKGTEDCETLNHLPMNDSSIEIMGDTHLYP